MGTQCSGELDMEKYHEEAFKNSEREKAEKTVHLLMDFINNLAVNEDYFVDALMREHRTLQQSVFGLFLRCCKRWSELNENQYDMRNEYTVKKSREIMQVMGGMTRAPMI